MDSEYGRYDREIEQVSKNDSTRCSSYKGKIVFRYITRVCDPIYTLLTKGYWVFTVFTNLKKMTKISTFNDLKQLIIWSTFYSEWVGALGIFKVRPGT